MIDEQVSKSSDFIIMFSISNSYITLLHSILRVHKTNFLFGISNTCYHIRIKIFCPPRMVYEINDFKSEITCEEDEKLVKQIINEYNNHDYPPCNLGNELMELLMSMSYNGRQKTMLKTRCKEKELLRRRYLSSIKKYYPKQSKFTDSVKVAGVIFDRANMKPNYGFYSNTILDVLNNCKPKKFGTSSLKNAAIFGTPLIIDYHYNHLMVQSEIMSLCGQCLDILSYNRRSKDPFDIHFSNFDSNANFMKKFSSILNVNSVEEAMITGSIKPPQELFPTEKLIYMSPHAKIEMESFDPDKIYILGGFVDIRVHTSTSSYIVAENAGIQSMRLPLEKCLDWGHGSKSLALNHVFRILSDLKCGACSSLPEAIQKHIPQRKTKEGTNVTRRIVRKMLQKEEKERRMRKKLAMANKS